MSGAFLCQNCPGGRGRWAHHRREHSSDHPCAATQGPPQGCTWLVSTQLSSDAPRVSRSESCSAGPGSGCSQIPRIRIVHALLSSLPLTPGLLPLAWQRWLRIPRAGLQVPHSRPKAEEERGPRSLTLEKPGAGKAQPAGPRHTALSPGAPHAHLHPAPSPTLPSVPSDTHTHGTGAGGGDATRTRGAAEQAGPMHSQGPLRTVPQETWLPENSPLPASPPSLRHLLPGRLATPNPSTPRPHQPSDHSNLRAGPGPGCPWSSRARLREIGNRCEMSTTSISGWRAL